MLVSLTVGKVDAGVTVLLTPDKRLIEFPSILLPPNIASGSIVDITVARNNVSESAAESKFRTLQERIVQSFGNGSPKPPVMRCRNATQTSVVLEWDPIDLATADLLSLSLFRNGQKAGAIPNPVAMHSTKISGLAVDTEYTFHLVLRTTAGTHQSQRVTVRTHKMTDLSGITITTGIMPATTRDSLALAVDRIGAKIVDGVRIDTTHLVTTEGRGLAWEKAVDMNIPVVRPEWVDACEKTGRILGVTKFYLDAARGPGDFGMSSQAENNNSSSSPTVERRISMPLQPQQPREQQQEKSLPPAPPAESESEGHGGGYKEVGNNDEKEARKKEEGGGADDESSSSSEEEEEEEQPEQKAQVPDPDEQKVRLEEKDVPIRPVALEPTTNPSEEPESEQEEEEEEKKEEEIVEKKGKPQGDGSSFQDVAL